MYLLYGPRFTPIIFIFISFSTSLLASTIALEDTVDESEPLGLGSPP